MDKTIFLRYALELAITVPASAYCFLPASRYYRFRKPVVYLAAMVEELFFILVGSYLGMRYSISSFYMMLVSLLVFYPSLLICTRLEWIKVLFITLNACMLTFFAALYNTYLTAPWEQNLELTWQPRTSLVCLLICLWVLVIFYPALYRRLPDLFEQPLLDRMWSWLWVVPLVLSALFMWVMPLDPSLMLKGRIRLVMLILLPLILIAVRLSYYLWWWIVHNMTLHMQSMQENSVLRLESKRYAALQNYLAETRTMRHDFRQHLRVISALARSGKQEELTAYLDELEAGEVQNVSLCANTAVDAIASYYDDLARNHDIRMNWTLALPRTLPVSEPDLCSLLGNLLDNAIQAVQPLPLDRRHVEVIGRMLSEQMLGISVTNPYAGSVRIGRSGLPVVRSRNHGIGLQSVQALVKKYNGSMDLSTDDGIFAVNILLYPSETAGK